MSKKTALLFTSIMLGVTVSQAQEEVTKSAVIVEEVKKFFVSSGQPPGKSSRT